jgi:hypothetical protein
MANPIPVRARGLTGRYRDFTAVGGIDFEVERCRRSTT